MKLIVIMFAVLFSFMGEAHACTAARGARVTMKIHSSLVTSKVVTIRSRKRNCRYSFSMQATATRLAIVLPKGRYAFSVTSPLCASVNQPMNIPRSRVLPIKLSCESQTLNALNETHRIIPMAINHIPLHFQGLSTASPKYEIVKYPTHGTILGISSDGYVAYRSENQILEDSFTFRVTGRNSKSNEASVKLESVKEGSEFLDAITTYRIASPERLQATIQGLTFNEVFNQLDSESLAAALKSKELMNDTTSIEAYLGDRGQSVSLLSLRAGGMLTGLGSLFGAPALVRSGQRPFAHLMSVPTAYAVLQEAFSVDPESFLALLAPGTLTEILFARNVMKVVENPITLITNELIPYHLGGNTRDIARRIAITLNFSDGSKSDSWNVSTLAGILKTIPDDQRTFYVTFSSGSPVDTLDPLRDKNGEIIEKFPGVPHRFPSYKQWAARVRANLAAYLRAVRDAFYQTGGSGSAVRYIAIDFESIRNDFESTYKYFDGQQLLLLRDPRVSELKDQLGISDADILAMPTWGASDPRRLKWDAAMLQERATLLDYAIGGAFREVFNNQDLLISNYEDAFRSDTVPNGAFESKEFRIWGNIGTAVNIAGNSLPSIPLYGMHYQRLSTPEGEILSSPPVPREIHNVTETEYYTRNATFVSTLNRLQSISASSSKRTNHYVTFSEFIDVWHNGYYGPCMRMNQTTKRYERQACGVSEGIGDFMFEYWALAAQNAEFINLYTLSTSSLPVTKSQALTAQHTMSEINRLLGYSDRKIAYDASVLLNGVKTSISGVKAAYGSPLHVWASEANNQRVFRVVFLAPNGFDKQKTVINSGSNGQGVLISFGNVQLEIPGGRIDEQSLADVRSPYGFFVTQALTEGKL